MSYAKEFPDFPASEMPAVPAGWKDESWHNDTCPTFVCGDLADVRCQLWIERERAEDRELPESNRFHIHIYGGAHSEPLRIAYSGDDWTACLAAMEVERLAFVFADKLYRDMRPEHWQDMRLDNRNHADDGICASHNFRDSNMDMHAAFLEVASRDPLDAPDGMADSDVALWNAAWNAAKESYLTSDDYGARFDAWRTSGRYVPSLVEEGQELGRTDDSDSPGMVYSAGFVEEWKADGERWLCNVSNMSRAFADLRDAEWFLWTCYAEAETRA